MPLSDVLTKLVPEGLAALKKGIRAYHGSPHDFDRFDVNKIGTGEGAQSYGHGLYFAEREGVARHYRDQLQKTVSPHLTYDGTRITPKMLDKMSKSAEPAEAWVSRIHRPTLLSKGQGSLDKFYDEVKRATDERDMWLGRKASHEARPPVASTYTPLDYEVRANIAQGRADDLNTVISRLSLNKGGPTGKMYEVDINADPVKFLDWDKPLSQQHPDVGGRVGGMLDRKYGSGFWDEYSGYDTDVRDLVRNFDDIAPARLSKMFAAEGVPGVRYLDQVSRRQADDLARITQKELPAYQATGNNSAIEALHKQMEELQRKPMTSNFVLFDDSLVNIARKYALPGMVGSGAAGGAMQRQGELPATY